MVNIEENSRKSSVITMEKIKTVFHEEPELVNPVLIEGLPGVGRRRKARGRAPFGPAQGKKVRGHLFNIFPSPGDSG